MDDSAAPAPFLKWAGGKRQLLPRILALAPSRIDTYYEPFLGGGAVFFALAARGLFRRAVLGDANRELIACYEAIRDDVDGVIATLRSPRYRNRRELYYRVRAQDSRALSKTERAARVIYLNRCGFNGLYRVNSKGQFNVPFGRYTRPKICDEPRLHAAARALAGVTLVCGDFESVVRGARPGDFVYLDPPYVPVSRTASFTAYAGAFGTAEQERLATAMRALTRRGVAALLSNSDCGATRTLYEGLDIESVRVRRSINSVPTARGSVGELLVRSAC